VFDIRRYAIHDGPGIRTAVFLKGCALSCLWCHNPESQSPTPEALVHEGRCIRCGTCVEVCPEHAVAWTESGPVTDRARCVACGTCTHTCTADAREIVGHEMDVEAVLAVVERDRPFYEVSGGGMTLTGGEPLFQRDFTAALLRGARTRGLHTVLDTCGFAAWDVFDTLRHDVDVFLYDVKLMDTVRHRHFTGVPNAPVLDNLRRLVEAHHRVVMRVPVVPGVTDDEENLDAIAALAADLPGLEGVELVPYHALGLDKYRRLGRAVPLPGLVTPAPDRMTAIADRFAARGVSVARVA
jgi:pyruvate formate lyase activating enzyme